MTYKGWYAIKPNQPITITHTYPQFSYNEFGYLKLLYLSYYGGLLNYLYEKKKKIIFYEIYIKLCNLLPISFFLNTCF